MFNADKITRTKLAMLVTSVLLTIFTTIGLLYAMTISNLSSIGSGDTLTLNIAMVIAIIIAFMWVIILILFYEFKTDDAMKNQIISLKKTIDEHDEFVKMLKATTFTPAVTNPDVLTEGGVTGHIPPK